MSKVKLKNLAIPVKAINNHKAVYNFLMIITYILFFPIAILQFLNDIFEIVVNKGSNLRSKIVNTIFKMLYREEMRKEN